MLLGLTAHIIKSTTATLLHPLSRPYQASFLSTRPLLQVLRFRKSGQESAEQTGQGEEGEGTEYSKWVLARSARARHGDVAYLRRREGRDRFSIHKLTNMEFMCSLASRDDKYQLRLNEKIILLAQMNHICNVLRKDKGTYTEFGKLSHSIATGIQDPEDYICLGTFINALVDLGELSEGVWMAVMDALLVRKYDEEYDELFGVYSGLEKYKASVEEISDYLELQRNKVIYNIPVVYRNSLEIMRQFIRYNTYNLKECRILLRAIHQAKVNDSYFWKSTADWFNIYIKEQLQQKDFEEFFIISESSVEKVLFDDGLIRPRSVLEETSQIAFILSEHGQNSHRYVAFIENLISYSIDHGSELFLKFLDIEKTEASRKTNSESLNEHLRLHRPHEQAELAKMQANYKTIFVNPTDLRSETIVQVLTVLRRATAQQEVVGQEGGQKKEEEKNDRKRRVSLDRRVLSWLAVRLCQPKMHYTLNELLRVVECRDILAAVRVDLRTLVLQKVKNVRSRECSLNDLRDIFHFLPLIEYDSISYILDHFLNRAHPKDILQLTRLFQHESMSPEDYDSYGEEAVKIQRVEESEMDRSHLAPKEKNKRWMPYLTKYFLKLPGAVNYHEKYYSFEENCYFLYLLLKNQEYWEQQIDYIYLGEMEKLKHSIKIASYSRGFKLQMGTYFYKLMNYIDLVSFFDGG